MKNIHILSTPNPSRLFIDDGILELDSEYIISEDSWIKNQNIYITSDEEIKEGDLKNGEYYLYFNKVRQFKKIDNLNRAWKDYKKIILTTDQDLIKYGVQAIDDNFLEWFVKNPSCEFVNIRQFKKFEGENKVESIYKIIIPKEPEPDYTALLQPVGTKQEQKKILIEMMQEDEQLGLYDEELEEAAQKKYPIENTGTILERFGLNYVANQTFIEGAKWMQERMYSEEEVIFFIKEALNYSSLHYNRVSVDDWFEQFKKK